MKSIKNIDTIIFDLDGTLLDTLEDLMDSVNYVLEKHNYPKRTYSEIRKFVGNGVGKLVRRSLPETVGNEECEKLLGEFKKYYKEHSLDKTKPYDDIIETLEELKKLGIKTAIVSNKMDEAVQDLYEEFFKDTISVAIGETSGIRRKPYSDMLDKAMKSLNSTSETTVYVGDSEVDIQTAINASVPCISVLWGFRDKDFLKVNDGEIFIEKPKEILKFIEIK